MRKPRVSVLTGTEILTELGIHTFRTVDGLWEEHRIEDMAAPEGFDRGPELVQTFYNTHHQQLQQSGIQPNAAHLALAKLQDAPDDRLLLVTQNIDNLRGHAGSTNVIHIHGELLKARCSQSDQVLDRTGDATPEDKCHCCQLPVLLRLRVVWLGEMSLGMDEIYTALSMADIFIAIGTSGHVYPAARSIHEAKLHGAHIVELNPEPSQTGNEFAERYYGPASQVVPELAGKLLKRL